MVAFTATDAAGNQSTTSVSLRIDSVAPVVTPGDHGADPANGDPQRRQRSARPSAVPFTVSEASTITATVAGPDGSDRPDAVHDRDRRRRPSAGTAGPRPASPCPTAGTRSRSAPATPPATSAIPVAVDGRRVRGARLADPVARPVLPAGRRRPRQVLDGHLPAAVARHRDRQGPRCERDRGANRLRGSRAAGRAAALGLERQGRRRGVCDARHLPHRRRRRRTGPSGPPSRPRCSPTRSASSASVADAVRGHAFQLTARSTEPLSTSPVVVVREAGVAPGRSR